MLQKLEYHNKKEGNNDILIHLSRDFIKYVNR